MDQAKKDRAVEILKRRTSVGLKQQQEAVAEAVNRVIVDRLVPPMAMEFYRPDGAVKISYDGRKTWKEIHSNAMRQMALVADIPISYVHKLENILQADHWSQALLADNLNELFHKQNFLDRRKNEAKFLHRLVGNEVRGFLSRSYNRKLVTAPLLVAFLEHCQSVGASPVEAVTTDVKSVVKCMMPDVFEPVDNEFVALGVTFTNSDFGVGRLKISGTIMRISSGTVSILEDKYSRTHLGSIIQDSDIEMSDETADKEKEAAKSAIGDAVKGLLSLESIDRLLKAIQVAHECNIEWYKLKEKIGPILNKKEIESIESLLQGDTSIVDLPPIDNNTKEVNAWWAANMLGYMATKEEDQEKKLDLQCLAGQFLPLEKAA